MTIVAVSSQAPWVAKAIKSGLGGRAIEPGGKIAAGPMRRELGILYADIDLERVGIARRSLEVFGHYSRPDIFQLHVNTRALEPVEFDASR